MSMLYIWYVIIDSYGVVLYGVVLYNIVQCSYPIGHILSLGWSSGSILRHHCRSMAGGLPYFHFFGMGNNGNSSGHYSSFGIWITIWWLSWHWLHEVSEGMLNVTYFMFRRLSLVACLYLYESVCIVYQYRRASFSYSSYLCTKSLSRVLALTTYKCIFLFYSHFSFVLFLIIL
jgi:hypothetical protein